MAEDLGSSKQAPVSRRLLFFFFAGEVVVFSIHLQIHSKSSALPNAYMDIELSNTMVNLL